MAEQAGYRLCTCIAWDVQAYSSRNDQAQSEVQHDAPRLVSRAARRANLDQSRWTTQSKGDEQLTVLPTDGSEPRLVDDYIRHLASELATFNAARLPTAHLRLRVAIHRGLVEIADNGFAGSAVVETCRLLNSNEVRKSLASAMGGDLVLVLSEELYRSLIMGGHTSLPPGAFRGVDVEEKEYRARAWLWVPGQQPPHASPITSSVASADSPAAPGGVLGNTVHAEQASFSSFNGPVDLRGGVVGFGGNGG